MDVCIYLCIHPSRNPQLDTHGTAQHKPTDWATGGYINSFFYLIWDLYENENN